MSNLSDNPIPSTKKREIFLTKSEGLKSFNLHLAWNAINRQMKAKFRIILLQLPRALLQTSPQTAKGLEPPLKLDSYLLV